MFSIVVVKIFLSNLERDTMLRFILGIHNTELRIILSDHMPNGSLLLWLRDTAEVL